MKTIITFFLLLNIWACKTNPNKKDISKNIDLKSSILEYATPESQGMNSETLLEMLQFVKKEEININSIVIARNGKTVLDAHFYPNKKEYMHDIASVTKSITSAIIGIAIDKGFIKNENQKVSDFFPEHKELFNSNWKKQLTVKHLLTMSSGLCSSFADGERQLDEMRLEKNTIQYILNQTLSTEPSKSFAYCSCGTQLLSIIITKVTGKPMSEFGKEVLLNPLNINECIFTKDKLGYTNAWGDSYWLTSDLLKIGQLYLNDGLWNGKQVISKEWIKKSATEQIRLQNGEESYGYLWWIPNQLESLYEGRGRGDQRLVIYPKENLVVVMLGTGFDPGQIGSFIIRSIKSNQALPFNSKANKKLNDKVTNILNPPKPNNDIYISERAKEIDTIRYQFEQNNFGLTHFMVNTSNPSDAKLVLGLDIDRSNEHGERIVPLGMNGVYKLSNTTRFGTPQAGSVKWITENKLEIDFNDFSSNHKYLIMIRFNQKDAVWNMFDEAGFGGRLILYAKVKG